MKHFQHHGLIASMEEIAADTVPDDTEAAAIEATVADESAEINDNANDIGVSVSEIEDAVQGGEELEAVGEIAADAVESGEGLSEDAAAVASIAIESIRSRLGFRAETTLVPATESFGATSTRLVSTRLVVEGIGDTLKKIWAAIKAAVNRVWDRIKSFVAKLFSSTAMLSKHIEGLRARARNLPSNAKMKEKKITSNLASQLNDGKQTNAASVKTIFKNTSELIGVCEEMSNAQKNLSTAAQALASGVIDQASVKRFLDTQNSSAQSIVSAMGKLDVSPTLAGVDGLTSNKGPKDAKGSKTVSKAYGPFIGNSLLVVATTDSEFLDSKVMRVNLSFQAPKGKPSDKVDALTPAEISEMLALAGKTALILNDYKKVQGNYEAITKATVKLADTVMSNASKILDKTGSDSETRQGLAELKTEVNNSVAAMNAMGSRAPQLTYALASAMANYASLCMRNLEAA